MLRFLKYFTFYLFIVYIMPKDGRSRSRSVSSDKKRTKNNDRNGRRDRYNTNVEKTVTQAITLSPTRTGQPSTKEQALPLPGYDNETGLEIINPIPSKERKDKDGTRSHSRSSRSRFVS